MMIHFKNQNVLNVRKKHENRYFIVEFIYLERLMMNGKLKEREDYTKSL